jgi:protoheme IX farnesyltransferase
MDSTLHVPQQVRAARIGSAGLGLVANLWALTKPEINLLIAITVLVSFLVARHGSHVMSIVLAFNTVMGTLLVSSGGAALNHFMERTFDSRMRRTARRPVVMGRVTPRSAFRFGATLSILGLLYLGLLVNLLSTLIASLALAIYLVAYTPLKRVSPLCTLVGAISGAAPPLIGWAGATGTLSRGAWPLYTLLFLWQFPHFMAIAWIYRDDYARAGYRVLPGDGQRQQFAALQAAIPAGIVVPVTIIPWIERGTWNVYLAGAVLFGFGFLGLAVRFSFKATNRTARQLLFASIVYLQITFILLLLNRG